jgi:hypothetical protein
MNDLLAFAVSHSTTLMPFTTMISRARRRLRGPTRHVVPSRSSNAPLATASAPCKEGLADFAVVQALTSAE